MSPLYLTKEWLLVDVNDKRAPVVRVLGEGGDGGAGGHNGVAVTVC